MAPNRAFSAREGKSAAERNHDGGLALERPGSAAAGGRIVNVERCAFMKQALPAKVRLTDLVSAD
jgi:hypothetical protein